jgi:shikimate kinase
MEAVSETGETAYAGLKDRLGARSIVLVGLMGAGKTAIGRKVAQALDLAFVDSDHEIETVSRMTIPELFERYGEPEFRALMNAHTRDAISRDGVSIWLKADVDTLMARVAKKPNRPLLKAADPRAVMERLMAERYPVYGLANIIVTTRDVRREEIMAEVIQALDDWLAREAQQSGDAA